MILDDKTPKVEVTVTCGAITKISVINEGSFWKEGAWSPYNPADKITIIENIKSTED